MLPIVGLALLATMAACTSSDLVDVAAPEPPAADIQDDGSGTESLPTATAPTTTVITTTPATAPTTTVITTTTVKPTTTTHRESIPQSPEEAALEFVQDVFMNRPTDLSGFPEARASAEAQGLIGAANGRETRVELGAPDCELIGDVTVDCLVIVSAGRAAESTVIGTFTVSVAPDADAYVDGETIGPRGYKVSYIASG